MTLIPVMLAASLCAPNAAPPARVDAPARHLLVSTHDGHVRALALAEGRPGATTADVDVGEAVGFLAAHPTLPIVYALGKSALFALAFDGADGSLRLLGRGAVGSHGTHVTVHPSGVAAIVASYGDHSVSLLPLAADGMPSDVAHTVGKSETGGFRRAHQARVHASTGVVHVPCLGEDHVAVLRLGADGRTLEFTGTARTPAGAGPRHMDYAPTAPFAYVLNEVASSITQLRIDPATGALAPIATCTTLPAGFTERTGRSSDLQVAPHGRFLFAINREPLDDIVTFAIGADGGLREVARTPTGGVHARTCTLDPTGSHLWVGNTKSKGVTSFRVTADGTLTRLGDAWIAPADVSCVLAR